MTFQSAPARSGRRIFVLWTRHVVVSIRARAKRATSVAPTWVRVCSVISLQIQILEDLDAARDACGVDRDAITVVGEAPRRARAIHWSDHYQLEQLVRRRVAK